MARVVTKNRINLEEDILSLWSIKEDIDTFLKVYCDHPHPMSEDQVYNYLYSIGNVLDLRMERLWDTFSQCFELDEYASDEALEARAKLCENHLKKSRKDKK
jgi:hypothetical protein